MTGRDDLSWLRHRGPVRTSSAVAGDDLSWIRHRRLPATAAPPVTGPAPAATPPPTSLDLAPGASTSLDLSSGASTPLDLPAGGSTSLDLSAGGSTSLDLSTGGSTTPGPSTGGSTSLDLSGGGPPVGPPAGGTSLDLSGAAPPAPVPFAPPPGPAPGPPAARPGPPAPAPPAPAARSAFTPPRTNDAAPTVLTPRHPSVRLTRLQSGIGALTFEAAWSPDEGFALGCAYQMDSGASSVLRPGETFGPLVMDRHAGHQRLRLDLLHGRHLRRLVVFGVPAAAPGPHWAGTLLIGTHGHARIEVPVQPPPPGPTVLLSLYNVDGEIVLRAEAQTVPGRIRDACLAFGYDRIAWRDADTAIPPAA